MDLTKKHTFDISLATVEWLKANSISHSFFEEVSSTNDIAKKEAIEINSSLKVYVARKQTQGRGRGENSWSMPTELGDSLMSSWSFSLNGAPSSITAPTIGLALYKSLSEVFPDLQFSLKAPNDVYLLDKKILGVLIETLTFGEKFRVIVGVGCNIFSAPKEVPTAGHLCQTGLELSKIEWVYLLEKLHLFLMNAVQSSLTPRLTEDQRAELLLALNRYPLLPEKYRGVSLFGDLLLTSKSISWRDL